MACSQEARIAHPLPGEDTTLDTAQNLGGHCPIVEQEEIRPSSFSKVTAPFDLHPRVWGCPWEGTGTGKVALLAPATGSDTRTRVTVPSSCGCQLRLSTTLGFNDDPNCLLQRCVKDSCHHDVTKMPSASHRSPRH